jgi:hypothetical protein
VTEPTVPIITGGVVIASTIVATAFSAPEWLTIITAISALVVVVGGVIVNVVVALRTKAVAVETKAAVVEVDKKADVITGHVNSAAAASAAKIDGLEKEIVLIRSMLADSDKRAALLAQAAVAAVDKKTAEGSP